MTRDTIAVECHDLKEVHEEPGVEMLSSSVYLDEHALKVPCEYRD